MRPFSIPVEVISVATFRAPVYPIKNFVILLNEREINSSGSGKKVSHVQGPYNENENVSKVTRGLCH